MKIICQNCFTILADRNHNENKFEFDQNTTESILQELSPEVAILTLSCPKCGCMLQVKV